MVVAVKPEGVPPLLQAKAISETQLASNLKILHPNASMEGILLAIGYVERNMAKGKGQDFFDGMVQKGIVEKWDKETRRGAEISRDCYDMLAGPEAKFQAVLELCSKIPGVSLRYPNLAKELREEWRLNQGHSLGIDPNEKIAKSGDSYGDGVYKRIEDAMMAQFQKGGIAATCSSGTFEPNFVFGKGLKGIKDRAKIYGCVRTDMAPEFAQRLCEWAREENQKGSHPYFHGKFYELDNLLSRNKLCLYVPFEEVPRVVKFLVSAKEFFHPMEMSHWLGIHLFPGVSIVIEAAGGHPSFDQSAYNGIILSAALFTDEKVFMDLVLHGYESKDVFSSNFQYGLLNHPICGPYFRWLYLKQATN